MAALATRPLAREQVDAALMCPRIFTHNHCFIRGPGGRTMPFHLWDYQDDVIAAMDEEQRLLVLKARQLGISWCSDAYALWLCTANIGQTVLILSIGLREAQEELARVRFMHERLPPELRRRTGDQVRGSKAPDTTSRLEFPDMDSRIISLPATEHAGTSYTATLVIIQELAKIGMATSLMAGVTPTIGDTGRLFVISTAKGWGGIFANFWRRAQDRWRTGMVVGEQGPPGSFRPVFISWRARPGRDAGWYDSINETLSDKEMRQEYPDTPREAFQGSSDAVFAEEFDRNGPAVLNAVREPSNLFAVAGGVDPGVNNAYGYLVEVQNDLAFVFREIHIEQGGTHEMGQALAAAMAEEGLDPSGVMVYIDPYDVGRNPATLETAADILMAEGLYVDPERVKYSPAQRVEMIKVLLKNERLFISLNCPDLIDALEQAEWATRRAPDGTRVRVDTYAKDGVFEHPLDAIGAVLCPIFPAFAPAAVEVTQGPHATSGGMRSYSGSEFGG